MRLLALILWMATLSIQAPPPPPFAKATGDKPPVFPAPAEHAEAVSAQQDFPFLPPLGGARLLKTLRVAAPLELKSATADDEAVLAGITHVKKSYARTSALSSSRFVSTYRDALFAAGWRLIDATKLPETVNQPETVTVSAHYTRDGRNIYARVSQEPDGPYEINVADVGAEEWSAMLTKECRLRIPSLHFDLDRPTLRLFESTPALEKLANVLKARTAPAVEIQGHMDNVGEAGVAARQTLSEARAKSVAAWLTSHGVPPAKIASKGYGKTRPVADNDSDLGRALNRRIEIVRPSCR